MKNQINTKTLLKSGKHLAKVWEGIDDFKGRNSQN
nr:hypothetical protein [Mucilaginibacter sp. SP1R1]